jgi:hypothetical protein
MRAAPDGLNRLRLRKGEPEKRMLEELLPICRYIQTYYRTGRYISVRWINGGQTYDAELKQCGDYVDLGYFPNQAYLEATCAMHSNEHLVWRLLSEGRTACAPEGITSERGRPVQSPPVVFTNFEHVDSFLPLILQRIYSKADKPYPENTSLLIQCYLNSLYTASDWRCLVSRVQQALPRHPFIDIFLVDAATQRSSSLAKSR